MTANEEKCAVVVCNEDKVNMVTVKRKWGADHLPIVYQYTFLGLQVSKYCSWDPHIAKIVGKGKAHVGKMDAILTDSHDTRMYYDQCYCMKARICIYAAYAWEGNVKFIKQLEKR